MHKLIPVVFSLIVLVFAIASPAGASASGGRTYLCQAGTTSGCKSLLPGASVFDGEQINAIAVDKGAWTWEALNEGTVNSSTFTYAPIDNALNGDTIWFLKLYANQNYCNGNSAGADLLRKCVVVPAQLWVLDPSNGYFVNIGRSNDKDNWEVLCYPGGGFALVIGTRDSCPNPGKEWSFVP